MSTDVNKSIDKLEIELDETGIEMLGLIEKVNNFSEKLSNRHQEDKKLPGT